MLAQAGILRYFPLPRWYPLVLPGDTEEAYDEGASLLGRSTSKVPSLLMCLQVCSLEGHPCLLPLRHSNSTCVCTLRELTCDFVRRNALQLVAVEELTPMYIPVPSIVPPTRDVFVEVVVFGLRNIAPFNLLPMANTQVPVALPHLSSSAAQPLYCKTRSSRSNISR